ncbi:hypothetical protein GCK72_011226 [Caenorhabditis remanei]|uniref:Uncharacterized protein n=1 Tax=Caenorhabditis remanei TaxID=31234 RepID=A0A6A5H7W9_CAERE|nr:hypothetical protein GCK72_011226 [Caenorhabditis remanei]KAF1762961.1 hypothetical protein GCK72_011226 [Caenorhabditis remanei]
MNLLTTFCIFIDIIGTVSARYVYDDSIEQDQDDYQVPRHRVTVAASPVQTTTNAMTTVVTTSDVIGDNVRDLWEENVDAGMRITRIVELKACRTGLHFLL